MIERFYKLIQTRCITLWLLFICICVSKSVQAMKVNKAARLSSPIACACKSLGFQVMGDESCTPIMNKRKVPYNLIAATCWMGLTTTNAQAIGLQESVVVQQQTRASRVTRHDMSHPSALDFRSGFSIQAANFISLSNSDAESISTTSKDSTTSPLTDIGTWAFLAYVVFSLAAGLKEFGSRFQKWNDNQD